MLHIGKARYIVYKGLEIYRDDEKVELKEELNQLHIALRTTGLNQHGFKQYGSTEIWSG